MINDLLDLILELLNDNSMIIVIINQVKWMEPI